MTINSSDLKKFFTDLSVNHQGQVLTTDNITLEALDYLIDMGLKQALGDVESVNKPAILGATSEGGTPKNSWKDTKRFREALRLGFTNWHNDAAGREALAAAWLQDATSSKFAKILSGELSVTSNGSRSDMLTRTMRDIIEAALTKRIRDLNASLPKAQHRELPTGRDMRKLVDEKMSNEQTYATVKNMAQTQLDANNALDI